MLLPVYPLRRATEPLQADILFPVRPPSLPPAFLFGSFRSLGAKASKHHISIASIACFHAARSILVGPFGFQWQIKRLFQLPLPPFPPSVRSFFSSSIWFPPILVPPRSHRSDQSPIVVARSQAASGNKREEAENANCTEERRIRLMLHYIQ